MDAATLLAVLILPPIALRWIGRLLQSGDAAEAGRQLERDGDRLGAEIAGCLRTACGCYIAYAIACVIGVFIWGLIEVIFGR